MENKKEKLREVPFKNYVIVVIIFIISIGLTFFLRNWYNSYQDYAKTIPILEGVVSEVRYNEIDNYIGDNQSAVIYIGEASDDDCRILEKDLKKVIEKKHLKDIIVYFNVSDIEDKSLLLTEFNDKYAVNERINAYPAFVIIEEGKIVDFKSKTAHNNLRISDIEQLLNDYGIQGD